MERTTESSGRTRADLIGYEFGDFVVEAEAAPKIRPNGKKVRLWQCRCSCGNVRFLNKQEIETQKRKSCGCKKADNRRKAATVHGDSHKRLHNIWSGIRARCYCETDYHYKWYGARGIRMDEKWKDDYEAFKRWALEAGYSTELTIERRNNNGDYTPENCRWATGKEQANNTRRNKVVTAFGRTLTLSQWSEETGMPYDALKMRLRRGWSPEEALTKPMRGCQTEKGGTP